MNSLLCLLGYVQGLTYIIFLFIGLPLKYLFGLPWVLTIDAALFMLTVLIYTVLLITFFGVKKSSWWAVVLGFNSLFLPFGPLLFERFVVKRLF